MSNLDEPVLRRTMMIEIDYDDHDDLIAKSQELATGIKDNSVAVNYDHPDWLRTKYQCCGNSGP